MHIAGHSLLISLDQSLAVINLGNLRENCKLKEPVEISLMIGKNLCTGFESTLKSLNTSNMKSIVSKDLKIDGVSFSVKCLYFDEVTGYLFITCRCLCVKGREKHVVLRL